jgi:hypothetical protein
MIALVRRRSHVFWNSPTARKRKPGIDSISLNPDTVLKTKLAIAEKEKELAR